MLVLYETALGYCLFKLTNDAKLNSSDLYKEFETPEQANSLYGALPFGVCLQVDWKTLI